jgi:hypothetical protein
MKTRILLATVVAAFAVASPAAAAPSSAAPSAAGSSVLTDGAAIRAARTACRNISAAPASITPYVCRGYFRGRRLSRSAATFRLNLRDPADGERCTAILTVTRRSSGIINRRLRRGSCLGRVAER